MSKAERTKQFIIERTAPIFNMKGYAGTSLSDMTEATGLTKGSIYGNFADKDEVALACFDHNSKVVTDIIRKEMDRFPAYRDKLRVYLDIYSGNRKTALIPGGCPMLNTTTDADDTHPALRARVGKAIIAWKERLVALVEAGKASKEFKATTHSEQTALTIIALLEGMLVISRATGIPGNGRLVIDSLEKLINEL